jgi:Domain of unknown function (DUF5615)
MALLYADEDFPQPVVEQLRALGHDVLTAQDDGRAGQGISDPDVLAHATALVRAVLTHNRDDFRKLHAANPNHAGIVTATRDADVAALAARIDAAISSVPTLVGLVRRLGRAKALTCDRRNHREPGLRRCGNSSIPWANGSRVENPSARGPDRIAFEPASPRRSARHRSHERPRWPTSRRAEGTSTRFQDEPGAGSRPACGRRTAAYRSRAPAHGSAKREALNSSQLALRLPEVVEGSDCEGEAPAEPCQTWK